MQYDLIGEAMTMFKFKEFVWDMLYHQILMLFIASLIASLKKLKGCSSR